MNSSLEETIRITSKLQTACYDSYLTVIHHLKLGMNETQIAEMIRKEMTIKGITEYWYNMPIFVLIGTKRFLDMKSKDYPTKSPHENVFLQNGDPIYIDIHPQDAKTKIWGDWNSMVVFHPRKEIDDEQVIFLRDVRTIQREGIKKINSMMTIADAAKYFVAEFEKHKITLYDPRNNFGHSMHKGTKLPEKRIFLDVKINLPLKEGIYAIEPGGYRTKKKGQGIVVGRFEEVIYISKEGKAELLGRKELLPLVI